LRLLPATAALHASGRALLVRARAGAFAAGSLGHRRRACRITLRRRRNWRATALPFPPEMSPPLARAVGSWARWRTLACRCTRLQRVVLTERARAVATPCGNKCAWQVTQQAAYTRLPATLCSNYSALQGGRSQLLARARSAVLAHSRASDQQQPGGWQSAARWHPGAASARICCQTQAQKAMVPVRRSLDRDKSLCGLCSVVGDVPTSRNSAFHSRPRRAPAPPPTWRPMLGWLVGLDCSPRRRSTACSLASNPRPLRTEAFRRNMVIRCPHFVIFG
jgi:hypothetical protein